MVEDETLAPPVPWTWQPVDGEPILTGSSARDARAGGGRGADDGSAAEVVIDHEGTILLANAAWRRSGVVDGGGAAVEVGANYLRACDAAIGTADDVDGRAVGEGLRGVLTGRRGRFDHTYRCDVPGGAARWIQLTALPVGSRVTGARVTHVDVTARERLQGDVRARSHLLDQVDAAVVLTDLAGTITLWNRGAEALYGWPSQDVLGCSATEVIVPEGSRELAAATVEQLTATGAWEGELTVRRRDGTTFPVHIRNALVHDAAGEATGVVGVGIDLSERRAMEERLARSYRELQAVTDGIGDGVCRIAADGTFAYVNAQAQHLLRATEDDLLGQGVLRWLAPIDRPRAADLAATATSATPVPVECTLRRGDGTTLPVEYLATPLTTDDDGPQAWVVVLRDITARRAREAALAAEVESLRWQQRIHRALDGDGLVLHAQPIVDLATGDVVHRELLVRMRDADDPTRLHPPNLFIPVAEASGLAPLIDRWVIGRAVELAAQGHRLHVNLSATTLGDDRLPGDLARLLDAAGVAPDQLVFEVTETALLEDVETARRFLEQLRELGCGLALDDFGTGFGGFTYLKQLPLDALKIDIEFVRDLVTCPASRHVVDSIVSLARAFGLRTVAEGVEDEVTLELLREAGVDWAQGYLLGRPVPLDDRTPIPRSTA